MAIRAVQEIPAPALAGAVDGGQLVRGARREQHVACPHGIADGELQTKVRGRVDHAVLDELDAVALDLGARGGEQLRRRHPVAREEPLHVRGGGVAGRARVDDEHSTACTAQDERGAQAGGAAADDRYVIELRFGFHLRIVQAWRRTWKGSLPFSGTHMHARRQRRRAPCARSRVVNSGGGMRNVGAGSDTSA
jgi:hypothetical protein